MAAILKLLPWLLWVHLRAPPYPKMFMCTNLGAFIKKYMIGLVLWTMLPHYDRFSIVDYAASL